MPLNDIDYGEKRNFIRMFIDADVSITDPITGQKYNGESRDLSGDGVSIVTKHEFELNQILVVNIRSKHGNTPPLSAKLEVKRVKKLDGELFEVAGPIEDVS
jgi:hypothetical protein